MSKHRKKLPLYPCPDPYIVNDEDNEVIPDKKVSRECACEINKNDCEYHKES